MAQPLREMRATNQTSGAHGGAIRGDSVRRASRVFEGRFGRMFRTLPAAEFEAEALQALAEQMTAKPETVNGHTDQPAAKPESELDEEENIEIPAGYTYLGQFIDHDITFDPTSSLQKRNDPDGLVNFRSPALDLDCVYGRGPDDQPYMYDAKGRKFALGRELRQGSRTNDPARTVPRDLPRSWPESGDEAGKARAIIGDKRNDENVIISQLHGTILQFHNRLADQEKALDFAEIQRRVRWHYQYVVLNDFLPRIVGERNMAEIWEGWRRGNIPGNEPRLSFYHPREGAYMPIEFSAAAYRFGHSMVRPIYRLNKAHRGGVNPAQATPDESARGLAGRFFVFAGVQRRGLNGFDAILEDWAIDWSLFFDINGSGRSSTGIGRLQPAYKIDPSLVNPLAYLPEFSAAPLSAGSLLSTSTLQSKPDPFAKNSVSSLALRNLLRGNSMGLPTGQDVARAMGIIPIPDDELFVGKATVNDEGAEDGIHLGDVIDLIPDQDLRDELLDHFKGRAPLWYYILAEARAQWTRDARRAGCKGPERNRIPVTLGPVGGRIVAETLIGLLISDSHSYLNQHPRWTPAEGIGHGAWMQKGVGEEWRPLENGTRDDSCWYRFTMGDFIRYAMNL